MTRLFNGDKLLAELRSLVKDNEEERDAAVRSQWFEKAAKIEVTNIGIKRAIQVIEMGDFDVSDKAGE